MKSKLVNLLIAKSVLDTILVATIAVIVYLNAFPPTFHGWGEAVVQEQRIAGWAVNDADPWARVEVRASTDDRDPALLVDVEMSPLSVPELAFVQITDPTRPRYAIDRDLEGRDTLFGTTSRNLDEELRAMKDGLAPGQVRSGMRLLGRVLETMERFCQLIGQEIFLIEPLFYHSAIIYERRGCGYLLGREVMEEIQAAFGEGGTFRASLDGSSPFRQPGAEATVRGRSWALHDGVGGSAWGGVKMYKAASRPANVDTFPGGSY